MSVSLSYLIWIPIWNPNLHKSTKKSATFHRLKEHSPCL